MVGNLVLGQHITHSNALATVLFQKDSGYVVGCACWLSALAVSWECLFIRSSGPLVYLLLFK